MIINPYRFGAGGTAFDGFGNASRSFDGSSDLLDLGDIGGSIWQGAGGKFSFALWVKGVPTSTFGLVLGKLAGNQLEHGLFVKSDGVVRFAVYGSLTAASYVVEQTDASYVSASTWTHIGVSFDETQADADKLKIAIDGSFVAITNTLVGSGIQIQNSTAELTIGAQVGGYNPYGGNIADVRIYDSILTEAQFGDLTNGVDVGSPWGHWLKDTVDLLDHAGNNDGTNYGSKFSFDHPSPAVEFGNVSRSFDGVNDYVSIPDNTDIPTGAQTICTWVKFDTLTTSSGQDLVTHWTTVGGFNQASFAIYLPSSGGKVRFYITSGGSGGTLEFAEATDVISALTWAHVACVFSPSNHLKIYIDGSLSVTLSTSKSAIHDSTVDLVFGGRDQTTVTTPFQGNLADVRIYDAELTSSDISDLYAGTHVTTNLVGHWLTNNDDVKDYAGTNDGTNYGSTYSYDNPNAEVEYGQASRVFNGTSHYIDLGDSDDFSFGDGSNDSPFSISAWVEVDTNDKFRVLSKSSTNNNEYFFGTFGSGILAFIFGGGDLFHGIKTTSSIPENEWIHLSCTYDGSGGLNFRDGMNIYINGVASTHEDHGGNYTAMNNTTNPLLIGKYANNNTFADGNIADVRIYDTELTATEVYELAKGVDHRANLIGQWLTNSDDVEDKAGTNDGTNYGSTYSTNSPL